MSEKLADNEIIPLPLLFALLQQILSEETGDGLGWKSLLFKI